MFEIFLFYPNANDKTYFLLFDIHLKNISYKMKLKHLYEYKIHSSLFTVHVKYKTCANITLKKAIFKCIFEK